MAHDFNTIEHSRLCRYCEQHLAIVVLIFSFLMNAYKYSLI